MIDKSPNKYSSALKVKYNFNSKSNSALKLLNVTVKRNNCQSNAVYKIFLTSGDFEKEINVIQSVDLIPNTEYSIEMRYLHYHDACHLATNIVVVGFNKQEVIEPGISTLCSQVDTGKDFELFRGTIPTSIYYTDTNDKKIVYFNQDTIFGSQQNNIDIISKNFSRVENSTLETQSFSAIHKSGLEIRKCKIDYFKNNRSAEASCENSSTNKLSLKDCKDMAVDKSLYLANSATE